jgi:ADP-ribose pyrophosphatase
MSNILLTSRKFTVERRQYNVAGKGLVQQVLVVHPGAVLILPILTAESIVLIRNFRYAAESELLELPAGTMEKVELPLTCAGRELEEETGYVAGLIEPLCSFYTTPGFTNERIHAFVATNLTQTQQRLDFGEQIRVEIMSLADALTATVDGRIIDAKTIAALHVYYYRGARCV